MFAKFLHRPALAIVISLLILFMGGLAINVAADLAVPLGRAAERAGLGFVSRCQRQNPDRLDDGDPGASHQRRARTCAT